jgi:hypothetical protein
VTNAYTGLSSEFLRGKLKEIGPADMPGSKGNQEIKTEAANANVKMILAGRF